MLDELSSSNHQQHPQHRQFPAAAEGTATPSMAPSAAAAAAAASGAAAAASQNDVVTYSGTTPSYDYHYDYKDYYFDAKPVIDGHFYEYNNDGGGFYYGGGGGGGGVDANYAALQSSDAGGTTMTLGDDDIDYDCDYDNDPDCFDYSPYPAFVVPPNYWHHVIWSCCSFGILLNLVTIFVFLQQGRVTGWFNLVGNTHSCI